MRRLERVVLVNRVLESNIQNFTHLLIIVNFYMYYCKCTLPRKILIAIRSFYLFCLIMRCSFFSSLKDALRINHLDIP